MGVRWDFRKQICTRSPQNKKEIICVHVCVCACVCVCVMCAHNTSIHQSFAFGGLSLAWRPHPRRPLGRVFPVNISSFRRKQPQQSPSVSRPLRATWSSKTFGAATGLQSGARGVSLVCGRRPGRARPARGQLLAVKPAGSGEGLASRLRVHLGREAQAVPGRGQEPGTQGARSVRHVCAFPRAARGRRVTSGWAGPAPCKPGQQAGAGPSPGQ